MMLDVRNMTQQQIADANNRWLEQMRQPFTGQPKRPMLPMDQFPTTAVMPQQPVGELIGGRRPYGVSVSGPYNTDPSRPFMPQQPAGQPSPVRNYLDAMQKYRQGGMQGARPTLAQFRLQPGMGAIGNPFQPQISGGPVGQPIGSPFQPQISGGPVGQPMSDPFKPQISGGPVGVAGGVNPMQDIFQQFLSAQGQRAGVTPPIQPMSDPFKPQISGGPVGGGFGPGINNYSAPQPMSDMFKPQISGGPVGMAGGVGTPAMGDYSMYAPDYRPGGKYGPTNQPTGIAGGVGTPAMGDDSMYAPEYRVGGKYGPTPPNPLGFAGGGTGMPPIGGFPNTPYSNGFNNPGQQPMTQPPAPMTQPPAPMTQPPAPMAMKKGGFAVKAVWDKKRPKDLGEPKDLSAKKENSAKARAKAAGRPYPNLIDNMAVARKKGK